MVRKSNFMTRWNLIYSKLFINTLVKLLEPSVAPSKILSKVKVVHLTMKWTKIKFLDKLKRPDIL
jgi:hypothetical protein